MYLVLTLQSFIPFLLALSPVASLLDHLQQQESHQTSDFQISLPMSKLIKSSLFPQKNKGKYGNFIFY
jgi:hypothetical protein